MHFQLWLHGGNVRNPFPLGHMAKRKRKWLIGCTIPRYCVLCVYGSKGQNEEFVSHTKKPKVNLCTSAHRWLNPHTQVLILCVTEMERRLRGESETCWKQDHQCCRLKLFFHEWKQNKIMLNLYMELPNLTNKQTHLLLGFQYTSLAVQPQCTLFGLQLFNRKYNQVSGFITRWWLEPSGHALRLRDGVSALRISFAPRLVSEY